MHQIVLTAGQEDRPQVQSVLLLTDGLVNRGIRSKDEILGEMRKLQSPPAGRHSREVSRLGGGGEELKEGGKKGERRERGITCTIERLKDKLRWLYSLHHKELFEPVCIVKHGCLILHRHYMHVSFCRNDVELLKFNSLSLLSTV